MRLRINEEFLNETLDNEFYKKQNKLKLKINESNYNHRKYNLISQEEYDYWFNIGIEAFDKGDKCVPIRNKELLNYYEKHNAKIGSVKSKKTTQITNAWVDGWTFANITNNV